MADKLIRELLIDVKQKGATRTAKALTDVANQLENVAAGSELTNAELLKMPRSLSAIEKAATKAAAAMTRMNSSSGASAITKSISSLSLKMDDLIGTMLQMDHTLVKGFNNITQSVLRMGNETIVAVEKTQDGLYDLNNATKRVGAGFDNMGTKAVKATRNIGNTSGAARGATREFSAMAKMGGTLPIMYAAIASNVFVLQAAFDQLKAGDQLNRLMDIGTIVGAQTGVPVQNLAKALQEATGYAVSFEEAMKQASTASAYGFDAKQIGEFALVARRAAAVLGVDMTDALNRVIKGVSKQEIELMDELGITIRLNDAFAAYVKQLNAANTGIQYNTQSLSTFQKQQAYANAVVAQSNKLFGQLDSVLRATPWEQFGANADSALKNLQMAAAKYLTPVISQLNTIFYQSKIAGMANEADAQARTNANIDPKNTTAMVNSLKASQDALSNMETTNKEVNVTLQTRQERLDQINRELSTSAKLWETANTLGAGGLGSGITPNDKQMALLRERTSAEQDITKLTKEQNEVLGARAKLQANYEERVQAVLKAYPQLAKEGGNWQGKAMPDPNRLKALVDMSAEYTNNLKNVNPDVSSAMGDLSTIKNAQTAAAGLEANIKNIKDLAASSGQSMDTLAANSKLGVSNFAELEVKAKAFKDYVAAAGNDEKNALALEQERNKVLKATGDTKKANNAVAKLEAKQIDQQITAVQSILKTDSENKVLQNELAKLQTQKLQAQNSEFSNVEKTRDVTDKIVGLEREMAMLNNTTMTTREFQLANLNMQVGIELERLQIMEKQEKKEKDIYNSRKAIAALEREIRATRFEQASSDIEFESGRTALKARLANMGPIATAQAEINAEQKRYNDLLKVAKENGQVLDEQELTRSRDTIADLQNQIANLKLEQARAAQDKATSSLGGVSGSTMGMDAESAAIAEQQNKFAFYDQALSKLGEIDSASTAVAQSIGNVINTIGQFAQGSATVTSAVAAGMQSVAQVMNYTSQSRISAIDAEIQAEKDRDGSSEESKNKIKRLEAQKIAQQKKSAQQQIAIQTAVAIMMAAANPWPFPAIPMMAAATIAGALSYQQAGSATIGSAGGGDDSAKYLSIGERQKNVDVSIGANAGELSYVQGAKGTGTANNFSPRAEGGDMLPGVGYLVGEHGPEIAVPKVPMKAVSNDNAAGGSAGGRAPVIFQITTMDARSFKDFLVDNGPAVRAALEGDLNQNGMSLSSLNGR